MGRYLCQLCYSIVHYGERHPCFFYKNDDEVYTVPPPNESEEMGREHEDTKGMPPGIANIKTEELRASDQESDNEECKETNSRLIENYERMSQTRVSKRKRNPCPLFPAKFLCGTKNRHLDSTSASLASAQSDVNKALAEMTKDNGKIKGSFAVTPQISDSWNSETFPKSAAIGSIYDAELVSVAGPSGFQMQSHGNVKEKPFPPDSSGEIFPPELHLPEQQRTETGEKTFVCHLCSKGFNHKGHLTRHLLTHTGEKPFVCDICSKGFARNSTLDNHIRTHTGEKPFVCHLCAKAFSQKASLYRHFLTHSGKKPFVCDICSKEFSLKANLEAHFRTHTGEKPFKCKFCDMYFTTQYNCNSHQQRKHVEM